MRTPLARSNEIPLLGETGAYGLNPLNKEQGVRYEQAVLVSCEIPWDDRSDSWRPCFAKKFSLFVIVALTNPENETETLGTIVDAQRKIGAAGLARMRLDGFVSLHAGSDERVLLTRRIK